MNQYQFLFSRQHLLQIYSPHFVASRGLPKTLLLAILREETRRQLAKTFQPWYTDLMWIRNSPGLQRGPSSVTVRHVHWTKETQWGEFNTCQAAEQMLLILAMLYKKQVSGSSLVLRRFLIFLPHWVIFTRKDVLLLAVGWKQGKSHTYASCPSRMIQRQPQRWASHMPRTWTS